MATVEEIEARRAARKAGLAAKEREQKAQDLEALDALEIEHGDGAIVRIDLDRYVPGLPTLVAFRLPKPAEAKRYQHMAKDKGDRPGDKIGAAEMLAASCRLYPDAEAYGRILEAFSALQMNAAMTVLAASMGKAAEEGKG